MQLKVKICGITNKMDALAAEKFGADALGFIFYRESKRYISPYAASEVIKALSPFTVKTGVFVNEEPDEINKIAAEIKLNIVQLHGNETPDFIYKIEHPVIKSFRINDEFDFNILNLYANVTYLFDSYVNGEYGGTGKKFNWNLIPKSLNGNFILSGGISLDNVEKIIKEINPTAIDVSSSLEKSPGIKDHKKTEEFFLKINSLRSI